MKVSSFTNPNERATGLFPEWFSEDPCHNKDFDLDGFIVRENEEICKANSHLTFVSIPDFHWAFDDYGYSRQGESYAFKQVALTLRKLLKTWTQMLMTISLYSQTTDINSLVRAKLKAAN